LRLWQAELYQEKLGTRLLFCVRDSYLILRAILTPNVQAQAQPPSKDMERKNDKR
jgi:hypothetical protein